MRQGTRFGAPRRRGLHAPAWIEPVGGLTGKHALLLLMRRLGARRRGCGPLHLARLWGRGRGPLHLTRLRGGRGGPLHRTRLWYGCRGPLHGAGLVRRLTPRLARDVRGRASLGRGLGRALDLWRALDLRGLVDLRCRLNLRHPLGLGTTRQIRRSPW